MRARRRASQVSRAGGEKASCSLFSRPLPSRHTQDGRQGEEGVRTGQVAWRGGGYEESDPVVDGRRELAEIDLSRASCATIRGRGMDGLMMAVRR